MKRCSAIAALVIAASLSAAAATESRWDKVPPKDHARTNPMTGKPQALQGGAALYKDHCAQCHGANALGDGAKKPPLRSDVVRSASDGDLEWFLRQGDIGHGMPSWSSLPQAQRWQIVSYLRSLQQ
jgi:mono/diheme cytochrome c family protein